MQCECEPSLTHSAAPLQELADRESALTGKESKLAAAQAELTSQSAALEAQKARLEGDRKALEAQQDAVQAAQAEVGGCGSLSSLWEAQQPLAFGLLDIHLYRKADSWLLLPFVP